MTIPLARGRAGQEVLEACAAARRPLLFLDLDGTLAPIVNQPRRARVPPATARTLQRLRRSGVRVVLVSGRAVQGVLAVARTPVDAILGDHGARLYEHGRVTAWLPASAAQFTHAADRLEGMLAGMPGVRFQRKERSLAIHLRLPAHDQGRTARRIARLLRNEGLRVLFGHRVLDAQLPGVDKGRAVMKWLRRHPRPDAVLYAGDDTTDEDAMRALAGRAFTVAVGPRPRHAVFRTSSPRTFAAWLRRLADLRARTRR
ncbi:MAG TPA: trehalose-phosphatase [Gemmatimonadales bacterium]|nr:trehalose-phosphatase [Gemmatimonadales bacterium]